MGVNERQVALRKGGNYTLLADFMDRRRVEPMPMDDAQELTAAAVNVKLLDSGVIAGTIALGTSSVENGGVFAEALAGAVGTGAITKAVDSNGHILNLVEVWDASTRNAIYDSNGRKVYGLIQADSGASDGDAIGAPVSENLQISFVVFGADGVLALSAITDTVIFNVNKLFSEREMPTIFKSPGTKDHDIIAPATVEPNVRKFVVTTEFVADEVITLSTGAGAASGVATPSGDTTALDASAGAFNDNGLAKVFDNGVKQLKGTEVVWDSTNTMHFARALDIGDTFEVEVTPVTE